MFTFPILITLYAGFTHAFEADHLLAVSSIVSGRHNIISSMKDGIFWGMGHASTIFFVGVLMILFRVSISELSFHYFEAAVGAMLISLAIYRMVQLIRTRRLVIHRHAHEHGDKAHKHLHVHIGKEQTHHHTHSLAYGVGMIHGLAGSGALVLVVMSQIKSPISGLIYLIIFGGGGIGGMLVAAGLFSLPFSKRIMQAQALQNILIITSSLLCLVYGSKVIFENIIA
jgi:hypothetical protein